jgi:ESCRT-II complex subunit VPS22
MTSRRGRGVGLSAFENSSSLTTSYATHGAALRDVHNSSLETQLAVLQELLHRIAIDHADSVKANPTYQREFARMCTAVGVDPMAGAGTGRRKGKGWWKQVFGGDEKDFYNAVGVRVVEVCRATRGENGGLLGVEECKEMIRNGKGRGIGGGIEVDDEYGCPPIRSWMLPRPDVCMQRDILQAVKALAPLGSGFSIITVGNKRMIRSIPKELNTDQSKALEAIQVMGFVTVSMLEDNLAWQTARAQTVMEDLVADGLVWVDEQAAEKEYWAPPTYEGDLED